MEHPRKLKEGDILWRWSNFTPKYSNPVTIDKFTNKRAHAKGRSFSLILSTNSRNEPYSREIGRERGTYYLETASLLKEIEETKKKQEKEAERKEAVEFICNHAQTLDHTKAMQIMSAIKSGNESL